MKHLLPGLALIAAGCVSSASPPPDVKIPATALAGAPCDPPMVIPAGIVASVRAQFEAGRTTPPPPITAEDGASYQKMQANQRASDWANLCYFRCENAALAAQPAPADRIVFMGDSITQSWLLAHPDFFGSSRVNRGISGQTTPQMLLRFKTDVLALKPRAVHILGGVNDIAGNTGPTTLEDIENNIMSMVELAKAYNVRVILATPLPAAKFNWAPDLKPVEAIATYIAWIRAYAAEQNLVLADYFTPLATPDGAMKPELTLDGVHPNKAGYVVMEPITQAAIAKALSR
jgi:lysophospholipase L1-like esterase